MILAESQETTFCAPAAEDAAPPGRYTLDGDDALEQHLGRTCARIVSGVRGLIPAQRLQAVILGGGYGRGEGGVLRGRAAGDLPYNDLELYVAVRGNRHINEARLHRRLEALGAILTHLAGVEVEFKVTSLSEISCGPVSMFSYDLAAGHRLLWGAPADLLPVWGRHSHPEEIPRSEATRLMMNRCSGLLLARERLERDPLTQADSDFVRRNVAKAQLACGDALLTAHGRYHWSCGERHRRLGILAEEGCSDLFDAAFRHHAAGVEFKLHPDTEAEAPTSLAARHAEVSSLALGCWLWIESRRLGRTFLSARAYAFDACDKWPGASPFLSLLLNLRADGTRFRARPSPWRHPRQRVLHALALLLWGQGAGRDPDADRRLRSELNTNGGGRQERLAAYEGLWRRLR